MSEKSIVVDVINNTITDLGIKQKIIAEKIGVSEDRVSRILSGKSKMLADEMINICVLLDIDPNVFRQPA